MSEYLSHISKDGRKQTNLEHLNGTAKLCGEFASHFGAEEMGGFAGKSHDIGKYSREFQERLKNNGKRVDHSTAGAFECWNLRQPYIAYAVIGHHSGLPDNGVSDEKNGSTFFARLNRAKKGMLCDYSAWKNELTLPNVKCPDWICKDQLTDIFFIRMLYSCLVDADFLDTASFMLGEPYTDSSYSDMTELNRRLDSYIADWFPPKNELNEKRCAILSACMERGENESSNLLTLTVPTGGGKTVASLAFALRRALRPDSPKRRIIYVIPYTSIIEQTAEIFRNILGAENVLEHHSGVIDDRNIGVRDGKTDEELCDNNIRRMRATENWDSPVIVTTAVQFFESLYANRSSKCRKLHNIAESVIIFDEAQMMPLPYLYPCIHAISQLIEHYNVTAVMCTATQPVLEPFFKKYLTGVTSRELCPAELQKDDIFRRVTFKRTDKISLELLAERLNECKQVLCIVNSRASAGEIYELLDDKNSSFHLSTLMTAADRKEVLVTVRERLSEGLPCRVVSTSLIEAGVDVDFPAVYREEAGLDSVMQAAGRCNREGKRSPEESIVTVFKTEKKTPMLFSQAISAYNAVWRRNDDIASAEAITQYFEFLYRIKSDESFDRHKILEQCAERHNIPFETVAKQFHLIENDTVTICIPTEESKPLIEIYRSGNVSRKLIRELGQYCVSVYNDHFKRLFEAGDIEAVGEEFYVLRNTDLYSKKTGLSLEADCGKAEFI